MVVSVVEAVDNCTNRYWSVEKASGVAFCDERRGDVFPPFPVQMFCDMSDFTSIMPMDRDL